MEFELKELRDSLFDLDKKITSNVNAIIKYRTWNLSIFNYFTNRYIHSLIKQTNKDYSEYKNVHAQIMTLYYKCSGLMNIFQKKKINEFYFNKLEHIKDTITLVGLNYVDDFKKNDHTEVEPLL